MASTNSLEVLLEDPAFRDALARFYEGLALSQAAGRGNVAMDALNFLLALF